MGLRSIKNGVLLVLVTVFCLAIYGCGPRITINQVDPLERTLETETMLLSNCDSDTELVSAVELQKEVDIEEYATRGTKNDRLVIPPDVMTDLETELELAFEPEFELAKTTLGEKQLIVPADTIRSYKVEWKQQTYNSTISFRIGIKTYKTKYTYELRIPNESGFIEIGCTP